MSAIKGTTVLLTTQYLDEAEQLASELPALRRRGRRGAHQDPHTLAGAGVPLARVHDLLAADPEQFAAALQDVDRQLRSEIRERQHHRQRISQLAAGDSLALPPEVVTYLHRMRELGFPERVIEIERDSWILLAAQMPDQVPGFMALKRSQIEPETLRRLYLDIGALFDCAPDDPRLPILADRVVAFLDAVVAEVGDIDQAPEQQVSNDLIALLDAAFIEHFPCAPRLLQQQPEQRGFTGWTNIRRVDARLVSDRARAPERRPAQAVQA